MRIIRYFLCVAALAYASAATATSGWVFSKSVDSLTDKNIATAMSSHKDGLDQRTAVVRCAGEKLEIYFGFGGFLNDDRVPVRYRLDKHPLVKAMWLPSADGSAVFATEAADLARLLMKAKTFVIEATDFRGKPYRASFGLAGAKKKISAVLKQCGLSEIGLDHQVKGLRHKIALDLERWGPKNISINKKILVALGAYNGPMDSTIEPSFALAVQRFYDNYIKQCKEGKVSGVNCSSLRIFWKSGMQPVMPPVSAVLYERAPEDLKKEEDNLTIGE